MPAAQNGLTAALPAGTAPFPGAVRPGTAPSFGARTRCLRLPVPAGADILRDQVVMLLLDDSGSMFHPQADRDGLRYTAAVSVVDMLRRIGVTALGIVHWGSYCPRDLLLRPISPMDVRSVDLALRMPPSPLGGTDLAAALRVAHSVADEDVPGLAPSFLVITDGLESLGRSLEAVLAELPPRSVGVLMVDRAGRCDAATEQAWRNLPTGAFVRLDASDPDDWAWAAAIALFAHVGVPYPALPDPSAREYLR